MTFQDLQIGDVFTIDIKGARGKTWKKTSDTMAYSVLPNGDKAKPLHGRAFPLGHKVTRMENKQ